MIIIISEWVSERLNEWKDREVEQKIENRAGKLNR